jgi:hypothetical protein
LKGQQLRLYKLMKRLLREPIVILVKGDWRTGKTDTSLLLAWLCLQWGLIDKIGSNIFTYDSPLVDYVDSTGLLKDWLHRDKTRKLFVFDEGLKSLYKRKAMSSMNVNMVTDILPEISKGHASMLVLSQIASLDSDIMHPAFCRAEFTKRNKKVMTTFARDYKPQTFTGLPSCQKVIRFDPDRQALFFNRELPKKSELLKTDRIYQIAEMYSKDTPMSEIAESMGLHAQQVKRDVQKALKWFVDNYSSPKGKSG